MERSETAKTVVGEDVEIVGSVNCASNIQLDGKLNGDLNCSGDAIIGNSANIKGNISVNSTTVMGQVSGNITAKDRIELKSTARVNGDIRAKRLTVEDGVTFVGKSEVNPSGTTAARKPAAPEAKPFISEISSLGTTGIDAEEKVKTMKEEIGRGTKEESKDRTGRLFGKK